MESSTSSFDGILEDLLTIPADMLEDAVRAYGERFPHHRERLRKFAADARLINRYFTAAKKEPERPDAQAPPRIGRFLPITELGRGSQGIVYKAEQIGIARTVALKVIREGVLASAKERLRFENEIQLISRLRHPSIVTIYDCGIEAGRAYFAMEYIDGRPLDQALRQDEWLLADALHLFIQIADAVSYAHQHGIIHRDLKPSNILVDSHRQAHILDFGLAKATNDQNAQDITEFGIFTGTWLYASPEQVGTGESVTDIRSDVYTLGIILFEMLTGCFPYALDKDKHLTRESILKTPPRRPSSLRAGISDDLDTIVLRALAKDADRRYQSAAALRDDVQRYLRNEAIEAKRDSRLYVLKKTVENYRWQFRGAVATVALLAAFSVVVTWLYAEARQARATIEARANVVRAGQQYTAERLRDLQMMANSIEAYKAERVDSIAVKRLAKPELKFPADEIQAFGEIPTPLLALGTDVLHDAASRQWLRDPDDVLRRLIRTSEEHRFRFLSFDAGSPWLMDHIPQGVAEAKNLCLLLVARAVVQDQEGTDKGALTSLSAARSVALDLADESSYIYKFAALEGRLAIYRALQGMVARAGGEPVRLATYRSWLHDDPPMPTMKYIRLFERSRILQYLESCVEGDPSSGEERLNLEKLNESLGGLYEQVGLLTPEVKSALSTIGLERVIAALDEFATTGAITTVSDKDAMRVVWPLLPDLSACEALSRTALDAKEAVLAALEEPLAAKR